MKKTRIISSITTSLTILLSYSYTLAAGLTPPPTIIGLPGHPGDRASDVLRTYINLFLGIVGILAVAFLIYGGFRYITSAGNEEQAEEAKKVIQNSIIGLVIIIFSYIIVTVIMNALANPASGI
jgi:cytochrome bd-type quinol oxidase subunit 2